jgi:hypothetical protein
MKTGYYWATEGDNVWMIVYVVTWKETFVFRHGIEEPFKVSDFTFGKYIEDEYNVD